MFTLPDLPYPYNALLPHIDEETMRIHHTKHHNAYVNNLNDALKGNDAFLNMDLNNLLTKLDDVPEDIRVKVRNNAGGHYNHSLFWTIMAPNSEMLHEGVLKNEINKSFGDFNTFVESFSTTALSVFGSGWVWLVKDNGKLQIISTPNQDSPVMQHKTPILGIDVWEHAYYLKYKNMRADYIKAWWNVVNWKKVEELF